MNVKSIYRLIGLIIIVIISMINYLGLLSNNQVKHLYLKNDYRNSLKNAKIYYEFLPLKDTIHILGNEYIYISLIKQTATLYKRNDTPQVFHISTGNPNISKGMETTTGVFTVQSKSPLAVSKQFDDAELFHWIGFNGNIGFHGLKGSGYYRFLGKNPSSHGCVRISKKDGEILYKQVRRGTPVMVFKDEPARVFSFSDTTVPITYNCIILKNNNPYHFTLLKNRLNQLYKGLSNITNRQKIYLDGTEVLKYKKIETGDVKYVPARHQVIDYFYEISPLAKDKTSIEFIESVLKKEEKL